MKWMLASLVLATAFAGGETAPAEAAEWRELFDGTSLKGWDGDPRFWSVEDGAITGRTTTETPAPGNTFLIWRGGEPGDFELKAEFRISGHNSGIQYRSFAAGDRWVVGGYQADIDFDNRWTGANYGEKFGGILARRGERVRRDEAGRRAIERLADADRLRGKIRPGGWNEYHIIARGRRLVHKVNGVTMSEVTDDSASFRPKGLLALQLHDGPPMKVQFRKLRLREFGPATSQPGDQSALRAEAPAANRLRVLPGFEVERVYSVPAKTQGSWVSLTVDPRGRLITSDQYGRLYRVTPAAPGRPSAETRVEVIDVEIGGAHGLLCAFGRLYVMANGKNSGLYAVSDTDGDDRYDSVEKLRAFEGSGEHGPHAVILSPDGASLYLCAGNHTKPPKFDGWLLPPGFKEDLLLPRMWDARGHAAGILAPGGWVARTDPEGKALTLVAAGFRNEYDIAFNPEGELFSYDADMEWDIGTPWYRPTRINHVTSGAEFGWRSGTGKWPEHYPDSLPSVVDIGPGSPTGIVFGTGARFPARYQRALFACDWSYGVLYAVHLEPEGASYRGTAERFVSGVPLPVTDVAVHPEEGSLWFTIGGRRAQSGLYRVRYVGDEATEPAAGRAGGSETSLRAYRARLESFHGRRDPAAVAEVWPALKHADRHVRYAARIALEHQPVEEWGDLVSAATHPDAVIQTSLALARAGGAAFKDRILEKLLSLRVESLDNRTRLDLLRAFGLVFARLGPPGPFSREAVLRCLESFEARGTPALDREITALLIYLEAPGVVARTLPLLHGAATQEDQIFYALSLRKLATGWTLEQRRSYFSWFGKAAAHRGGLSFGGFLKNIRREAVATLDDATREALGPLLSAIPAKAPPAFDSDREFVAKWTVERLLPGYRDGLAARSHERGRALFAAASCYRCHRVRGEGGSLGPDLTSVSGRYGIRDLLTHVLEPAKEVSDQYRTTVFFLKNGDIVDGRVVNISGERILVSTDMMDPSRIRTVKRSEVDALREAESSQMPTGLLDTFTEEEIKDLMAFLISRGDPAHAVFK